MTFREVWANRARRDLAALDRELAQRVVRALNLLAAEGRGDVKRLEGQPQQWRLRVGDVRVIFTFDYDRETLEIARVLPRGRAYRR